MSIAGRIVLLSLSLVTAEVITEFHFKGWIGGCFLMGNEDLMAALRELLEASSVLTSGQLPTETDLERYKRASDWARRLISREEKS